MADNTGEGGHIGLSPQFAHVQALLERAQQEAQGEAILAAERVAAVQSAAQNLIALGIEGAMGPAVIADLETKRQRADSDFSILTGCVDFLRLPQPTGAEINESLAADAVGQPPLDEAPHSADSARDAVFIYLLNNDGRVEAEDGKSAGPPVRDGAGLSQNVWSRVINSQIEKGLVTAPKPSPGAKRYEEIALNVDLLEQEISQSPEGVFPQGVIDALTAYRDRRLAEAEGAASPRGDSGSPSFLIDGVGVVHPIVADAPDSAVWHRPEEVTGDKIARGELITPVLVSDTDNQDDAVSLLEAKDDEIAASLGDEDSDETDLEDMIIAEATRSAVVSRKSTTQYIGVRRSSETHNERQVAEARQRQPMGHRTSHFSFSHGPHRTFDKWLSTMSFGKLSPEVRLLIAVGQSTASTFSFLQGDPVRKSKFILNILNKGVDSPARRISQARADTLLAEAIAAEHIFVNGDGPELTDSGFDCMWAATKKKGVMGVTGA